MQTAAYILAHASAAQVNSRTMISVTHAVDGTMYTDVATQQQRYIAGIRASNGQPYFEWSDIIKDGTWTETMVVNQGRVYSVDTARGSDAGSITRSCRSRLSPTRWPPSIPRSGRALSR